MVAMFQFVGGGIGVMPDPADNDPGHTVPNRESGTRISFEVLNVGDEAGVVTVDVEVDDVYLLSWQSDSLGPGLRQIGYASLGRLTAGSHTALVILNPGSGTADHDSNTFDVA